MTAASGGGDAAAFPWEAVLHAGLCRMRLPPRTFWAMTPRELGFALGLLRPAGAGIGRAGLLALMGAFPDENGARDGRDQHHAG